MKDTKTPEESKNVIGGMKDDVEKKFLELSEVLYEAKTNNLHSFYGYPNFKEFVEGEYGIPNSLAAKLINNYRYYLERIMMDEDTALKIGTEKLAKIRTIVEKVNPLEQQEWLTAAEEKTLTAVTEMVKDYKGKHKKLKPEEVYVTQVFEKVVEETGWNKKTIMFLVAALIAGRKGIAEELKVAGERAREELYGGNQ